MKVLFISAAFPPMRAGEADHAYHQCRDLARRGLDVHVLTSQSSRLNRDELVTVAPLMRDWSWTDLPRFARFVKACAPDVILLYYIGWIYNEHPMITFAPTVCKRILPQCRVVTMFAYPQGSNCERFSVFTRLGRKITAMWATNQNVDYEFGTLLRDSDAVIVLSAGHREILAAHYEPLGKKATLVPPPPLLNKAHDHDEAARAKTRKDTGIGPEHFLIACFGFIYPPKGVETVLRAFHLVCQERPEARLIMIGGVLLQQPSDRPDFAREMRDLPGQLGFADKVVWTGEFSTEGDEASRYLYAADAGVFGHDLGVAMNNSSFAAPIAHGLPVVATQGATVEGPIVHGDNVFLCRPKSPDAMARALLTIMADHELRNKLRRGALQLATEWFSWEKATDRVIQVLTTGENSGNLSRSE